MRSCMMLNQFRRLFILLLLLIKPGFHYPSSRAELTARQLGCIFDTRQLRPSTRVSKKCNRVQGPSTPVVETGL